MEDAMKTIGIDIGTTSLCAVCYDAQEGKIRKKASADNAFLPGSAERGVYAQDPERIVALAENLAEQIWEPDVEAVGISSQMHGILYVDGEGKACSPFFTWKNEEGNAGFQKGKSYAEYLKECTGSAMASGYGSVTHFVRQKTGSLPAEAVKFANIGDYLAMRLTGNLQPLTDASIAASFGGFDLAKGSFMWEDLKSAGIDVSYYPQVAEPGMAAGEYRGVRVYCACGDNQASFLGAVENPEHSISVNVGTGSQVSVFSKILVETDAADVRPFFGRGFLYVGATLTGGKAYERLADFFEEAVKKATGLSVSGYQILEKLLGSVSDTDLQVDPAIYGSRDGSRAGGSIRNLRESNFHAEDLALGFVNGMAGELWGLFSSMPAQLREEKYSITASGNGLRKNRGLVKAVEQIFGMSVKFTACEEEAAAGAAAYAAEMAKEAGKM